MSENVLLISGSTSQMSTSCGVAGCVETHSHHVCRKCKAANLHRTQDCPSRCKAPDCLEAHTAHHCNLCRDADSDHRSHCCPVFAGGVQCRATGCQEAHSVHNCRSCGVTNATHKSENCPTPQSGIPRCKAAGCASPHTTHFCRVCVKDSVTHRSQECPEGVLCYHQTDGDCAKLIMQGMTMIPGTVGAVGGGIYFATTIADTDHKAHKKGFVVEVRAFLGKQMDVPHPGDPTISHADVKAAGCDSVKLSRAGGTEYVLYEWGRASVRRVHPR